MSEERTEIETFFGRCRCCLSYGYLKNMWSEHLFEGEAEIYGEMLVQCFQLTWEHSEESLEQDQICEQCITRLRDANDFKKLILDSQDELLSQMDDENKGNLKQETSAEEFQIEYAEDDTVDTEYTTNTADSDDVKDETEYEEIEYLEDDDAEGHEDTDTSQPKSQLELVKRRKKSKQPNTDDEDGPPRKWPKKLPKSERYKTYKQYSEIDLRKCLEQVRNKELTASEASVKYNIPKKTICGKLSAEPKSIQQKPIEVKRNSEDLQIKYKKRFLTEVGKERKEMMEEMKKHHHNLSEILLCSNATPILAEKHGCYLCGYCEAQYADPAVLKKHTLDSHQRLYKSVIPYENKYSKDLFCVKLDITDLRCKLCSADIDTLEILLKHLKDDHNRAIHTEIKNQLLPFKFNDDILRCCICSSVFQKFRPLQEHMHIHYRYFVCDECDMGFITKACLKNHIGRHKTCVLECNYCSKIFKDPKNLKDHESYVHLNIPRNKCFYCDERFRNALWRDKHMAIVHDVKLKIYKCQACDRTFSRNSALSVHTRRYHLMERQFKCPECDKAFFNGDSLKHHMVKHTKSREFKCELCFKLYSRRSNLIHHMERHSDKKPFKCELCGRAFVQKGTLNRHMRNIHEKAKKK